MLHGTIGDQGAIKAYVVTSKDRWAAAPMDHPLALAAADQHVETLHRHVKVQRLNHSTVMRRAEL